MKTPQFRAWMVWSLVLTITGILGVVDWQTGDELNFFAFYLLPVGLAAWHLGFGAAVILAVMSSVVWFWANAGQPYSSHIFAVWNTIIRLASFLAIGWAFARLKQSLHHEREATEALRRSLSEVKVLETFLPICAQCKKIRNQKGVWQHLEVYIGQHSNTQFSHGYCPACARAAMQEAGLTDHEVGVRK